MDGGYFSEDDPYFTTLYRQAIIRGTYNFFTKLFNWYGILMRFWGDFELGPLGIHPYRLGEKI